MRVENGAAPDVGNTSTTLGNNKITNSSHYCIWNRNSGGTPQVLAEGNYFGACTGASQRFAGRGISWLQVTFAQLRLECSLN